MTRKNSLLNSVSDVKELNMYFTITSHCYSITTTLKTQIRNRNALPWSGNEHPQYILVLSPHSSSFTFQFRFDSDPFPVITAGIKLFNQLSGCIDLHTNSCITNPLSPCCDLVSM